MAPPASLLFFGSDAFSIACLTRLLPLAGLLPRSVSPPSAPPSTDGGRLLDAIEIVTPPDNFRTKVPEVPLKSFSKSHNLPIHTAPPKSLKGWQPPLQPSQRPFDVAVVVSFGYFLPASLIRSFPLGAINVHPSLLPKYRGAAPIQHTILNGETETGVSIIELHEKEFDAGRILKQTKVPISPYVFYKDLHDQLADVGSADLVSVVHDILNGKVTAVAQEGTEVSHAPKIKKSLAEISWETMTREHIYRLHRAIGYKIPLTTYFRGKRTQILGLRNPFTDPPPPADLPPPLSLPAGSVVFHKSQNALFARCADGWIGVDLVKVEGRKEQKPADFANGYKFPRSGVVAPAPEFAFQSDLNASSGIVGKTLTDCSKYMFLCPNSVIRKVPNRH
ncbi:formyl transferase [Zopfochytrium polystomum]|nr:formyl transferase [Zopfochytrium polystomum]